MMVECSGNTAAGSSTIGITVAHSTELEKWTCEALIKAFLKSGGLSSYSGLRKAELVAK